MLGAAWLNMRAFLSLCFREGSLRRGDTPAQGGLPPGERAKHERTLMFGGLIYCLGLTFSRTRFEAVTGGSLAP